MTHNQSPIQDPINEVKQPHDVASAVSSLAGAVALSQNLPPAQTSFREDYWKKPTKGQIDNAAKLGFDLTQQSKY